MTAVAALAAIGHFLAFFALSAALALQLGLLGEAVGVDAARRLRRADRAAGIAALALLAFGFARVFYFDKGAAYYLGNWLFWFKLVLFGGVFLLAWGPIREYSSWRDALAAGRAPGVDAAGILRLRRTIHWQLVLVMGMLVCASLMARGFGN